MQRNLVISFYKFTKIINLTLTRNVLTDLCKNLDLLGSILLAHEGINGSISGCRNSIRNFMGELKKFENFSDIQFFESEISLHATPFHRMRIKLKKEIVTLGIPGIDPTYSVGKYIEPSEWNGILSDSETLVIDTRNSYEIEVGSFRGAQDPNCNSFREFPRWVKKNIDPTRTPNIAIFCTGGIRCEKASSFLLDSGFQNVSHLRGGILNYLSQTPTEKSFWFGECFVFDNRVTVDHTLREGTYDQCHACRRPINSDSKKHKEYIEGIQCPKCMGKHSNKSKERFIMRQKQSQIARTGGEKFFGVKK